MSNLRSLQLVKYLDAFTPIHAGDPDYYLRRDEIERKNDDYHNIYMKNRFDMMDSGKASHNYDHIPEDYETNIDEWYEKDARKYTPMHANDPDYYLRHDDVRKKDNDYYFAKMDSGKASHNDDHIPGDYETNIDEWYEKDAKKYTPMHAKDPDYYLRRDEVERKDHNDHNIYMKNHFDNIFRRDES